LGVTVHGFRVQRFRVHRKAEPLIRSIVGWVKREVGTIYVGFAYLNTPQKFEIATKLANPTKGKNSFLKNQMTIFLFISNFLLSKHLSASVPLWLNDYNK
jgi:hypothetical protein